MADRRTTFLLGLIAAALCAIALRPLLPALDASAQTPAPGAPATATIAYQLVEATQTFQAESSINKLAAQGWRAKSVAVGADRTVVLMEKTVK
jgi:hypothetical protein